MIHGLFINSRPFLPGRVVLRSRGADGVLHEGLSILFFLIDTGADLTMLRPKDYEMALNLPLSAAPEGSRVGGLGSAVTTRHAEGVLTLQDDSGRSLALPITFAIPEPAPDQPPLLVPVLGRDVWGLGRLVVDRPNGVLTLELPLPSL